MAGPRMVRFGGPGSELHPLFFPSNRLDAGAPLRWLRLGWRDLWRAPVQSIGYGAGLVLVGYFVTWQALGSGNVLAPFTLAVAFILFGPVLAFGLYALSRQLEQGRRPRLGLCCFESRDHLHNELLFTLILLLVLLVWSHAAALLPFFFPVGEQMGIGGWLRALAVGGAVGAVFAVIVFTSSVVALPLMLDRGTDAVTSAFTSMNAVLRNKGVMTLWALIIAALVSVGFVTAYIGLAVVLPLIGHASWHAYRETVKPTDV